MNKRDFFRKKAVAYQENRIQSSVILKQPPIVTYVTFLLVIFTICSLAFISFGTYSRKEVVSGFLELSHGVIKYKAPQDGILLGLNYRNGEIIKSGANLSYIYSESFGEGGVEINNSEIIKVETEIKALNQKIKMLKTKNELDIKSIHVEVKGVEKSLAELISQRNVLLEKQKLSEEILGQQESLRHTGYISEIEMKKQQDSALTIKSSIFGLNASIAQLIERQQLLNIRLNTTPIEQQNEIIELNKLLIKLSSELEISRQKRQRFIRSFSGGVITNILVNEGERVEKGQTLFSVLPTESDLRAVIYVPSRAYGFIEKGQKVQIRYNAFPYQKFGIQYGVVSDVGTHLVFENETKIPGIISTPSYRVTVELESQKITAYGKATNLKAGMKLEADIILESRNIIEWLFEPVFSIYGRLGKVS